MVGKSREICELGYSLRRLKLLSAAGFDAFLHQIGKGPGLHLFHHLCAVRRAWDAFDRLRLAKLVGCN